MRYIATVCAIVVVMAIWPRETQAIPPPDVLSNIGSSFVQIFSLVAIVISLAFSFIFQYFKRVSTFLKRKPIVVLLIGISTLAIALSAAYTVTEVRHIYAERAYEKEIIENLREEIASHDAREGGDERSAFFRENGHLPLLIGNEEFSALESAFVLDAREDEEYEIGRYPGSTHIRFADILAGRWIELPRDRVVYVICWSGIRGSEVAAYLREKGILARALEGGATSWGESGGIFEGEIAFSKVYSAPQYGKLFSTEEVKFLAQQGAILIDVRQERLKEASPIPESVSISAVYTASNELDTLLTQVPVAAQVITICGDFVSCFDAKIVGIKIEKQGGVFLGRYATPWEYEVW